MNPHNYMQFIFPKTKAESRLRQLFSVSYPTFGATCTRFLPGRSGQAQDAKDFLCVLSDSITHNSLRGRGDKVNFNLCKSVGDPLVCRVHQPVVFGGDRFPIAS